MTLLQGIKILDITRIIAGPFCTQMLGDMGARVLKIEHPRMPDETRKWGPPFLSNYSAYFASVNRNKESITCDFSTAKGKDILSLLASKCDVVVENFGTDKLKSKGLGYEELSKENKGLIYVSITGYGSSGHWKERPGYDVLVAAESGLISITGEANRPPVKVGVAVTDLMTGLYAHGAILAALFARQKTGLGQKIDISLYECQLASLVNVASSWLNAGVDGKRYGTAHASIVPYQSFMTSDGQIVIAAVSDIHFIQLCTILNLKELAAKYPVNKDRVLYREILVDTLQKSIINWTTRDLQERLSKEEIPYGVIRSVGEAFSEEQSVERQMIETVNHPIAGPVRVVGVPVKFSRDPLEIRTAPPLVGQDTEQVLKEFLSFSTKEIEKLKEEGVI